MSILKLHPRIMTVGELKNEQRSQRWLWHGYLHDGEISMLTSQWKTGKTTLVAGLLRAMAEGGQFLGRALRPGRAWVVSEETPSLWASRLETIPIGEHVQLLARPFRGRPSMEDWQELVSEALSAQQQDGLALLVIDPLASFLPGGRESDPTSVLAMFESLQPLTEAGVAVLVLHHPRKKASEPLAGARGTGAMLAAVDIILEISRFGRNSPDNPQRLLLAQSRRPETPERLVYEWSLDKSRFAVIEDPLKKQFEQNWRHVMKILKGRTAAATHLELLNDWPPEHAKPGATSFYDWLRRAYAEKKIRREGSGTSRDPWRYRLENEDDKYYDRGELPPLRDLPGLG